jgi:hypothetical protein
MQPTPPFWFKQRQGKLELVRDNTYKATAPNQGEAFLAIRPGPDGRWEAAVRGTADGADLAITGPEFESPTQAWEAAFELYRRTLVV